MQEFTGEVKPYIREFLEEVYPKHVDLALSAFNEKTRLEDATDLIKSLQAEADKLREQVGKMKELLKTKGYLDQVWKQNEEIDKLRDFAKRAVGAIEYYIGKDHNFDFKGGLERMEAILTDPIAKELMK